MSQNQRTLQDLYPFLHGGIANADTLDKDLMESVRQKCAHGLETKQAFFSQNGGTIVKVARAIANVYQRGGRLFTMGNGGSACDAAHFAVEFLHPVTAGRPALSVTNLSADIAMLTAVGNDVGFDHVFTRQLCAMACAKDGVVGFSTSGNSTNLLKAFAKARELGLMTLGFSGGDGGEMARGGTVDHCLVVRTDSIHRIQEVHVATYHILWDLVHSLLAETRGDLNAKRAAT